MAEDRDQFAGAFINNEEHWRAFEEEADRRGDKTAIIREMFSNRYGKGATTPGRRKLAMAVNALDQKDDDLMAAVLQVCRAGVRPKDREIVLALADTLAHLSARRAQRSARRTALRAGGRKGRVASTGGAGETE